jgi:excisionase family DNA binding protein
MSVHSCGFVRDGGLQRELYSPREVEHVLSISHAGLYRLLAAGRLSAVKIGRSTYIPRTSIEQFLASLPAAKIGEAARSMSTQTARPAAGDSRPGHDDFRGQRKIGVPSNSNQSLRQAESRLRRQHIARQLYRLGTRALFEVHVPSNTQPVWLCAVGESVTGALIMPPRS